MKKLYKKGPDGMSKKATDHFLNHPEHPYWLHCLCEPIVIMCIDAFTILLVGYFYKMPTLLSLFLVILSCFCLVQLGWFESFHGHGVRDNKVVEFSFMRLPNSIISICFVVMMLFLALTTLDIFTENNIFIISAELLQRYQFLFLSADITFALFLVSWRYHVYYETFYMNKKRVRQKYLKKGYQKIDIDIKINNLREQGKIC